MLPYYSSSLSSLILPIAVTDSRFLFQTGIAYIAQVLKRNRTLKVLNLSENKVDVQCLVIIAEALVSLVIYLCLIH